MTGQTGLGHRGVPDLLGEALLLVTGEAEIIPGLLQQRLFVGRMRVVTAETSRFSLGTVLHGGMLFDFLKVRLLRGVAGIADIRALLRQDHRADQPVPLVAGLAFLFLHRGMDDLLGELLALVRVASGIQTRPGREAAAPLCRAPSEARCAWCACWACGRTRRKSKRNCYQPTEQANPVQDSLTHSLSLSFLRRDVPPRLPRPTAGLIAPGEMIGPGDAGFTGSVSLWYPLWTPSRPSASPALHTWRRLGQIGRASCRERV